MPFYLHNWKGPDTTGKPKLLLPGPSLNGSPYIPLCLSSCSSFLSRSFSAPFPSSFSPPPFSSTGSHVAKAGLKLNSVVKDDLDPPIYSSQVPELQAFATTSSLCSAGDLMCSPRILCAVLGTYECLASTLSTDLPCLSSRSFALIATCFSSYFQNSWRD